MDIKIPPLFHSTGALPGACGLSIYLYNLQKSLSFDFLHFINEYVCEMIVCHQTNGQSNKTTFASHCLLLSYLQFVRDGAVKPVY